MECKKCGATAVEGASFCGRCGARIDGKVLCKSCGKLNLEEHDFCVYCGARIDGKTVCVNCGGVHAENFCPFCGTAAKPQKTAERKTNLQTVADIVANAVMLLGAVLSLIFVFFIGLKMQVEGVEESTQNIFYYFGEYAKDMQLEPMDTTPWFGNAINTQLRATCVIGIILSVAILATTVTFAVIAIVKYAMGWIEGKHANVEGWSLASIICFLIGAVTYFAFNNVSVSGDVGSLLGGASASGGVKFNEQTVTAIVLCAICVVTSVVFRMICEGKSLWTRENATKQILTLVSVLLAAAVFGISQGLAFTFSINADGVSATVGASYIPLSGGLTIGIGSLFNETTGNGYYDMTNAVATMNNFSIFASIFALALSVFAGLALMENLRGATGKKDRALLWSILALVSAVLTLVFSIVAVGSLAEIFNVAQTVSGVEKPEKVIFGNFVAPILSVVFALALFLVNLIKDKTLKKA